MRNEYSELQERGEVNEVGRFTNQYEEEFAIYRIEGSANYFLTGREFDWQIGLKITEWKYPIVEGYLLNDEEREKIQSIIEESRKGS